MSIVGLDLDLRQQIGFYAAYHSNFHNQLIHVVFVPTILFSAFLLVAHVGPKTWTLNLSTPAMLFYCGYYVALDSKTGSVAAAIYFTLWCLSQALIDYSRGKKAVKGNARRNLAWYTLPLAGLLIQAVAWWAQIVPGHTYFEGRKPALMDSFVQSLVLAPLFVVYEFMWMCFPGYEPGLKADVDRLVAQTHKSWGR